MNKDDPAADKVRIGEGLQPEMIVVVGITRVADIYLGEFMRLYSHHAFRESLSWRDPNDPPKPLSTGDWWQDYFGSTPRSIRRKFFARIEE